MLTSAITSHHRHVDWKMSKKQKPVWTILDNKLPDGVPSYEYPYSVPHSFDRGSYRDVAKKVIVPKIVLDQIIDKQCWTERPHCHVAGRSKTYGGGAAFATAGPGAVGGAGSRPKSSGRAKALNLRREKALRPGLKAVELAAARNGVSPSPTAMPHPSQSSPSPVPHPSQSVTESVGSQSSSSTTCRDMSATPPLPTTSSISSCSSSREATSTPPTFENMHFDPNQDVGDSEKKDTATPEAIPKASSVPVKSNLNHTSPVFTPRSHKELAGSASPVSPQGSQGGVVEVAEVAEMFSGLSLSPASLQKQQRNLYLNWTLDDHSLCFSNIPLSTTTKDLIQRVECFGKVTNIAVLMCGLSDTAVAYVRMEKKSACDWVISCFHGNPFESYGAPVECRYALEMSRLVS